MVMERPDLATNDSKLAKKPIKLTHFLIISVFFQNIKEEPQGPMLMERPDLATIKPDPDAGPLTINEAKVKKVFNEIEKKHFPANRQMKTDCVFDCLRLRADAPALLAEHGVIYNPKLGKYHLQALSSQRKLHKNA